MNKLNLIAIAFLPFFLSMCSSNAEIGVRGVWSIDTIYYRNDDVRACLLSNIVIFHDEYLELPTTANYVMG